MGERTKLASCFLVVALSVAPAQADPVKGLTVISGAWARAESCNAGIAREMPLADLLADPDAAMGECISVEGIVHGNALFLRKSDARRKSSTWVNALAERRVGLYGQEASMESVFEADMKRVRLVGSISDCDSLHSSDAIMLMGYCHYTTGPILLLAEGGRVERR
ncbi:MAG: hypothetical protein R3B94_11580 [Hyphomonas sp.]